MCHLKGEEWIEARNVCDKVYRLSQLYGVGRGAGGCDANLCCSLVDVDFGLSTLHYALPEPFGLGSLVFGR